MQTDADGQTDGQTDRRTDRQTDRQTDREVFNLYCIVCKQRGVV